MITIMKHNNNDNTIENNNKNSNNHDNDSNDINNENVSNKNDGNNIRMITIMRNDISCSFWNNDILFIQHFRLLYCVSAQPLFLVT